MEQNDTFVIHHWWVYRGIECDGSNTPPGWELKLQKVGMVLKMVGYRKKER